MASWLSAVLIGCGCLLILVGGALLVAGFIGVVFVRRGVRGHCPRCDYDLAGLSGDVCPECGWARPRGRVRVETVLVRLGLDRADRVMVRGGVLMLVGGVLVAIGW